MIPGSNLLGQALMAITPQAIAYYRATGRTVNTIGEYITAFAAATTVYGSFQPLSRALYSQYNLDLQKSYYTFYTSSNVIDIERDISSDQIRYNNQIFQCISNNDWYAQDGWKGMMCVYVGNAS